MYSLDKRYILANWRSCPDDERWELIKGVVYNMYQMFLPFAIPTKSITMAYMEHRTLLGM